MRLLARVVIAVAIVVGAGCRGASSGGDDDAGVEVDAPEGPGCTAMSPRTVEPEAFVGPTGLQARLSALIDGAAQTLDVQMYLFTVGALADRIIAAHDRGVDVRVIFDPDHTGNTNTRNRFMSAGVPHRNAPSIYSFSHAKYLVIDGEAAVIMSMNFNADAMTDERNYGVITRDADDVTDLQAIFEMDWASGGGEPAKPADLACTRLIVSPNNAKPRLLGMIEGAASTLDIEVMYVAEDEVRAAIVGAKQRGVEVRVILEASSDNAETRSVFLGAGIEVRGPNDFFNHAKLLIADGVAFVGSVNFSQTALTRNREVGAFLFEPTPAAVIQQQFDTDWNAGQ